MELKKKIQKRRRSNRISAALLFKLHTPNIENKPKRKNKKEEKHEVNDSNL